MTDAERIAELERLVLLLYETMYRQSQAFVRQDANHVIPKAEMETLRRRIVEQNRPLPTL